MPIQKLCLVFTAGQESSIVDKNLLSELWKNRRLMALHNDSHEEKNCTKPGKKWGALSHLSVPLYCAAVARAAVMCQTRRWCHAGEGLMSTEVGEQQLTLKALPRKVER